MWRGERRSTALVENLLGSTWIFIPDKALVKHRRWATTEI